jgi:membrane protein implicated in regulation of membrane protease activity
VLSDPETLLLAPVALLRDIAEPRFQRGQVGTIAESLDESTVLVEFRDDAWRAYAVIPCIREILLPLRTAPLAA